MKAAVQLQDLISVTHGKEMLPAVAQILCFLLLVLLSNCV